MVTTELYGRCQKAFTASLSQARIVEKWDTVWWPTPKNVMNKSSTKISLPDERKRMRPRIGQTDRFIGRHRMVHDVSTTRACKSGWLRSLFFPLLIPWRVLRNDCTAGKNNFLLKSQSAESWASRFGACSSLQLTCTWCIPFTCMRFTFCQELVSSSLELEWWRIRWFASCAPTGSLNQNNKIKVTTTTLCASLRA